MTTMKNSAMCRFNAGSLALGTVLLFGLPLAPTPVSAATQLVRMVNFAFQPKFLTNRVGDTVIWTNTTTTSHNTVSSNNVWASSLFTSPGKFSFTFNTPGVYGYRCVPHAGFGMVGIVYVQGAPNEPPTIAITNPSPGATFTAPAKFTLQAEASDADGSVTNVQFFQGTTLLGDVSSPPYELTVSNLTAATYDFTTRALDNAGAIATSAVASVSVADLRFGPAGPISGGEFPLLLLLTPGLSYSVEVSPDLDTWEALTNFAATSDTITIPVPAAGEERRFFRARVMPNP